MKIGRLDPDHRAALAEALRSPRHELVPTASARAAAEALPDGSTVTVTASPRKGIEATVDLAVHLSGEGFAVVPHIAARLVRDRGHLGEILDRLGESGIGEIFVIGGDGHPRGDFTDALALIHAIVESGHRLSIGIAGYPEGHPLIADPALAEALAVKQEFASYVTTQMCFDEQAISRWIAKTRERGVSIPALIGVTGVVAVTRLLPVAARIGVGDSIRFLTRHRGLWRRLLAPHYSPTWLLVGLAPTLAEPALQVAGLHIYSFNQVAATEAWRRGLLDELDS